MGAALARTPVSARCATPWVKQSSPRAVAGAPHMPRTPRYPVTRVRVAPMLATAALRRTVKRALSGEQLAEVRRIRERARSAAGG